MYTVPWCWCQSWILPLGAKIAEELAGRHQYPFNNCMDLSKVAQFLAITQDPMYPKEEILKMLKEHLEQWEKTFNLQDFLTIPCKPLSILADLPIPIYMTTNYDDLMFRALKARQKDPRRDLCRWNKYVKDIPSVFDSFYSFEPTPANPVIFYLHGHDEVPESLVLTEDDYLNFLVNISKQQDLLPLRIQRAIAGTSLLFIGYKLADLNFRVIFQGIVGSLESSLRRISVAVQLPPDDVDDKIQQAQQKYLTEYFGKIDIQVYWGTAKEFAIELRKRWRNLINDRRIQKQ